jgi:hypothetical protein
VNTTAQNLWLETGFTVQGNEAAFDGTSGAEAFLDDADAGVRNDPNPRKEDENRNDRYYHQDGRNEHKKTGHFFSFAYFNAHFFYEGE